VIAVSDASPLCYLILIGQAELLPVLFGRVGVPRVVVGELLHRSAPEEVRAWVADLPAWVEVYDRPQSAVAPGGKLHAGEEAAILVAEAVGADIVLIDERAARRVALNRGLRVTGTLGVLVEAASLGLVDLAGSIERLRSTNFRCSPALLKATMDRFGGE
jgi:predicted nucleic acid-binding protein